MSEIDDIRRDLDLLRQRLERLAAADVPNQALDTASTPTFAGLTDTGGLNVGTATGAATGQVLATAGAAPAAAISVSDAGTATVTTAARFPHRSSGTPAGGFGSQIIIAGDDNGASDQDIVRLEGTWVVATHASRTPRLRVVMVGAATREYMRCEDSGAAPMLGFYGVAAVVRAAHPTLLADVITILTNLGLCN